MVGGGATKPPPPQWVERRAPGGGRVGGAPPPGGAFPNYFGGGRFLPAPTTIPMLSVGDGLPQKAATPCGVPIPVGPSQPARAWQTGIPQEPLLPLVTS